MGGTTHDPLCLSQNPDHRGTVPPYPPSDIIACCADGYGPVSQVEKISSPNCKLPLRPSWKPRVGLWKPSGPICAKEKHMAIECHHTWLLNVGSNSPAIKQDSTKLYKQVICDYCPIVYCWVIQSFPPSSPSAPDAQSIAEVPIIGGGEMERDQISDIRPQNNQISDIRPPLKIKYMYQISHPLKNQISDIWPQQKSNIRYHTPKNQISDIKVPPFHPHPIIHLHFEYMEPGNGKLVLAYYVCLKWFTARITTTPVMKRCAGEYLFLVISNQQLGTSSRCGRSPSHRSREQRHYMYDRKLTRFQTHLLT